MYSKLDIPNCPWPWPRHASPQPIRAVKVAAVVLLLALWAGEAWGAITVSGTDAGCTATTGSDGYTRFTYTGTGSHSFTVAGGSLSCDVLLVGGGGGSGNAGVADGGGGGGGVVDSTLKMGLSCPLLLSGSYAILVGSGGTSGATSTLIYGGSSAIGSLVAFGGQNSIAGVAAAASACGTYGQSANPCLTNQGNSGGHQYTDGYPYCCGGGGGAGGPGLTGSDSLTCGNGGPGIASNISGSTVYYAGGGGGGGLGGTFVGTGGTGGGGTGGMNSGGSPTNGVDNTGGGAGGVYIGPLTRGGSGIVIIRFLTSDLNPLATGTAVTLVTGSGNVSYSGSGLTLIGPQTATSSGTGTLYSATGSVSLVGSNALSTTGTGSWQIGNGSSQTANQYISRLTLNSGGGTIQVPSAANVLSTAAVGYSGSGSYIIPNPSYYDTTGGTYGNGTAGLDRIPTPTYVLTGYGSYGPGGYSLRPTATVPSGSNALTIAGSYGVGGNGSVGTYNAPTFSGSDVWNPGTPYTWGVTGAMNSSSLTIAPSGMVTGYSVHGVSGSWSIAALGISGSNASGAKWGVRIGPIVDGVPMYRGTWAGHGPLGMIDANSGWQEDLAYLPEDAITRRRK